MLTFGRSQGSPSEESCESLVSTPCPSSGPVKVDQDVDDILSPEAKHTSGAKKADVSLRKAVGKLFHSLTKVKKRPKDGDAKRSGTPQRGLDFKPKRGRLFGEHQNAQTTQSKEISEAIQSETDPKVIEACLTLDACNTQLKLLRKATGNWTDALTHQLINGHRLKAIFADARDNLVAIDKWQLDLRLTHRARMALQCELSDDESSLIGPQMSALSIATVVNLFADDETDDLQVRASILSVESSRLQSPRTSFKRVKRYSAESQCSDFTAELALMSAVAATPTAAALFEKDSSKSLRFDGLSIEIPEKAKDTVLDASTALSDSVSEPSYEKDEELMSKQEYGHPEYAPKWQSEVPLRFAKRCVRISQLIGERSTDALEKRIRQLQSQISTPLKVILKDTLQMAMERKRIYFLCKAAFNRHSTRVESLSKAVRHLERREAKSRGEMFAMTSDGADILPRTDRKPLSAVFEDLTDALKVVRGVAPDKSALLFQLEHANIELHHSVRALDGAKTQLLQALSEVRAKLQLEITPKFAAFSRHCNLRNVKSTCASLDEFLSS